MCTLLKQENCPYTWKLWRFVWKLWTWFVAAEFTVWGACKEVGQQHTVLLYHAEVKWLIRLNVFLCVWSARRNECLVDREEKWLDIFIGLIFFKLRYLTDVFTSRLELSRPLQGRGPSNVSAKKKLPAFKDKIASHTKHVKKEKLSFPSLEGSVLEVASLHPNFVA